MGKHRFFARVLWITVTIGCAVLMSVSSSAAGEKQIVMDITTHGSRTDGAWSQHFYEAYMNIKDKHPEVEVSFTDMVDFGEMPSVLEFKCKKGPDLIYIDSVWLEAIEKIAPKYPKIWFVVPNLTEEIVGKLSDNVTCYSSKDQQGAYMSGVAAGMVTKTNILGYVGAMDYPSMIRVGKAFELGAKSVNPEVKLLVMYTGDWIDVQKGYEAGKALIEVGADVLLLYCDNAGKGVFKAAKDNNVYMVGQCRDQVELAPKLTITGYLQDHIRLTEKVLSDFKSGQLRKGVFAFGIEEGWPVMAPLRNVSPEAVAKVNEARESIKKGEIEVPVITDPKTLRRLR